MSEGQEREVPPKPTPETPPTSAPELEPVLPSLGELFFECCPRELELELPRLLPLKSPTQLRLERLQREAENSTARRLNNTAVIN